MSPAGAAECTYPLGAVRVADDRWRFTVWAPLSSQVSVRVEDDGDGREVELAAGDGGYHSATVAGLAGEPRYRFVLADGQVLADPASRRQPDGVHGPSQGFDPQAHVWHDAEFVAPPARDLVIYELHVGTFSDAGTFDSAIEHLDELAELGINAVEPMPIASFPGTRNWGYDGVFPYAVQESYGGPAGFQRFVDACHERGLAVILDVVYNHLGPEGAVHASYGPYLTDTYATPWGAAMNFSEAGSDEVRRYFRDNALMWLRDFHVDGLRFDAVHGIVDPTASPFLRETTTAIAELSMELGRQLVPIAESGDNNPMVVTPAANGGLGFRQQWNDDFHHALHTVLTGEQDGYYRDYGRLDQLAAAFRDGFVFRGEYSAFRGRRHGVATPPVPCDRLVVFAQNHDQIGNRADAARLAALLEPAQNRLAVAATLLSPNIPLLFMGEEYAATTPFPYFVDHEDADLLEAVRQGRAKEFGRDADELDPAAESTYDAARLDRTQRDTTDGAEVLKMVRRLIELRRTYPLLRDPAAAATTEVSGSTLTVTRRRDDEELTITFDFAAPYALSVRTPAGSAA
ncbi:MAG TPA: malto-oligosyltrehalose trehalohydrolase [Mycobacteriales bacterium]|nr:malto-oligosyltrehalose trehalohydrolase [Mycobacteriales bacterium]